jgi:hypothetical protein
MLNWAHLSVMRSSNVRMARPWSLQTKHTSS